MNTYRQTNPPVFTSKSSTSSKTNAYADEDPSIQELLDYLQNNRVAVNANSYSSSQYSQFLQDRYQFNTTQYNINNIANKYFDGDFRKAQYFLLNIM